MISTGDTIENPVTGERITFLATSADTDGEAVVIETVVRPARLRGGGARPSFPERALRRHGRDAFPRDRTEGRESPDRGCLARRGRDAALRRPAEHAGRDRRIRPR
jgi:hypothetical protein